MINSNNSFVIASSIKNGYRLKIRYKTGLIYEDCKMTERIIRPIEMKFGKEIFDNKMILNSELNNDVIFVKAFCELRKAERHFRLDKMEILYILKN